jgi:hypothetical protein
MDDTNRSDITLELHKALSELRGLRDEARLKIHLASMDARDAWARIEPSILDVEREAVHASAAALQRIENTVRQLRELVASL